MTLCLHHPKRADLSLHIDDHRRVLALATPIMVAMVSQNIVNLIDIAMVGSLGNNALAAVGLGAFFIFTLQALTLGGATGVQILTARQSSEDEYTTGTDSSPLLDGLSLAIIILPIVTLTLFVIAPQSRAYLHADPIVAEQTIDYFQARILGLTFVAINFAFRGYWSAIERTRVFLAVAIAMHLINILLNYALIYGNFGAPALGVAGAGWASAIAAAVASVSFLYLARLPLIHALKHWHRNWIALLRLAIPYGLQQAVVTLGIATLLWIIGLLGTDSLAAATVVINLAMFAVLPAMGLGIAAATLVSGAWSNGQYDRAKRWMYKSATLGIILLAAVGLPFLLIPDSIVGLFIDDPDIATLAKWPLRIVGMIIWVEGVAYVLLHGLYSIGKARIALAWTIGTQWILFLPVAYLFGPILEFGLTTILLLYGVYRIILTMLLYRTWQNAVRNP